jgi:hypothetical protein
MRSLHCEATPLLGRKSWKSAPFWNEATVLKENEKRHCDSPIGLA